MATKQAGNAQAQDPPRVAEAPTQEARANDGRQPLRSGKTFRVLALDGGGIRGVAVARILEEIEKVTKKAIHEQFDLVIGTSTGGLLSVMMTVPVVNPTKEDKNGVMSAEKAKDFYYKYGTTIFKQSMWYSIKYYLGAYGAVSSKYKRQGMHDVIKMLYGKEKTLVHAKIHVGVVCTDRVHKSTILFNDLIVKHSSGSEAELRTEDDIPIHINHPKLHWVVPATSAAPTYFDPVILRYKGKVEVVPKSPKGEQVLILEDGGVNENNPANLGFKEAKRILKLDNYDLDKCKIDIISIGTGTLNPKGEEADPALYDPKYWSTRTGWFGAANEFTSDPFKMNMKSFATHSKLAARFTRKDKPIYGNYARVQFTVTKDQLGKMDNAKESNLDSLCTAAETFLFERDQKGNLKHTQKFLDVIEIIMSTTASNETLDTQITEKISSRPETAELFNVSSDKVKLIS